MARVTVDFYATEPHFVDHLAPMWAATENRGVFWTPPQLRAHADARGITAEVDPPSSRRLTVVAAFGDLKRARALDRRCVLAEHGAGQSYAGVNSGSYIGGLDRAGVVGVLVPGERAAERHRAVHPTIPAYVIGCPKLDAQHQAGPPKRHAEPVVAISFHWNCTLVPETKSAYRHYAPALEQLVEAFPGAIGHGHPRILERITRQYRAAGLEVVVDFAEVLNRADVYACDNSSTMFEFASTGRPVVVLNAPWYRRKVNHGGRFWEWADVGPQVHKPGELVAGIALALVERPADRRTLIVNDVYGVTDGTASKVAASAIGEIAETWGAT